jgi:uncharacterized membrane protein YjjP (DUF1212 family)
MERVRFLLGKLTLVLASLVASVFFAYLFGTFKFAVLPISFAVLFVLYYFMVQREEKAKKVVSSDSL